MMNTQENKNSPLKSLQHLFADRPDVLKLLDPGNLDTERIAGEVSLNEYRTSEGFASPVNLYVTGRTKAGKTSFGNTILDGKQTAMKSTGRRDCTDNVGCFQSANNLRYFDLPGAGSSESYENINRAALCVKQIAGRRGRNSAVEEFVISDYTEYHTNGKPKDKVVTVSDWQSKGNQLKYEPDVILYVIAPHEGLGRDDEDYLFDLLSAQKDKRGSSNVIFALNLHLTESNQPKYTKANLEDAHKIITDVYKEVYPEPSAQPTIIEINSLIGTGSNKVAEAICQLLPVDKLGKMEQVLGENLKSTARKVRSQRFLQALIYVASRLATLKVDESSFGGNDVDIVNEAFAAVYSYSLKVFKGNDNEVKGNIYSVVGDLANQTSQSRTESITIEKPTYGTREITTTTQVVEYGEVESRHEFVVNEAYKKSEKRSNVVAQFVLGNKESIETRPKTMEYVSKTHGITGVREEEISLGTITEVTGTRTEVVGSFSLKGGYEVIEGILSIGLGVETAQNGSFNDIVRHGKGQVKVKIGGLAAKIEKVISGTAPRQAEEEIIKILQNALASS
jgi:hypothetical protein